MLLRLLLKLYIGLLVLGTTPLIIVYYLTFYFDNKNIKMLNINKNAPTKKRVKLDL